MKEFIAMKNYQCSVDQKLIIMKGIFHNIECGIEMDKDLDGNHMLANSFLSAHIFELAIKSLWELSHSKVFGRTEIGEYGHNIDRVCPCLRGNFREFIEKKYNAEVTYFRNGLQEILNSDQYRTEAQKGAILSCPYFSLEECLKENSKIVKGGKYKFQQGDKINVITGIFPRIKPSTGSVECYRQPSPFLEEIMKYIKIQLSSPDYVKNLM